MKVCIVVTIPLTERGHYRGGRYYWKVMAQGKQIGSWGFSEFPQERLK